MSALTIGASKIHQIDGLYSLNDLHKAARGNPSHRPGEFLRLQQTADLIVEIQNAGIPAVKTSEGRNGGAYACRELVIAYAAWISPSFHLQVIRVFLETRTPPAAADRIKGGSRSLPEDVEAAISERVWDLIRVYSETIRQDIRGRALSEPARAFDIINTANLTGSLIPPPDARVAPYRPPPGRDAEGQTMTPFPENSFEGKPMKELIAIAATSLNGETVPTVNARDLHAFLEVQSAFKDWITRRIADYDFQEGRDFCSFLSESQGGRPARDYALSLDMAKELCMVERNEKGKQARLYFIECERRAKTPPVRDPLEVLNDPSAMRGLLLTYSEKVLALQGELAALTPKVQAFERLAEAEGGLCPTDSAKALQVKPKKPIEWMSGHKWTYRRLGKPGLLAYQDKIQAGLLLHKVYEQPTGDGGVKLRERLLITPKGLTKLAEAFNAGINGTLL